MKKLFDGSTGSCKSTEYGCTFDGNMYRATGIDFPIATNSFVNLTSCRCKGACSTRRCLYGKGGLT